MTSRVLRRKSQGFEADTRHIAAVAMILAGAMLLLNIATRLVFYAIFTLQSVTIPDHAVGDDPLIEIRRSLRAGYLGGYMTYVEDAKTAQKVCVSPWDGPFPYSAKAGATRTLHWRLSKWMGPGNLPACEKQGFGAGDFVLVTCHKWYILGNAGPTRCVASNVFARRDKNMDED